MSTAQNAPAKSVAKEDLEAILDSLVDGIVLLDAGGGILGINRAACEILEVQKHETVGVSCCEVIGEQLGESAAAIGESIRSRRPVRDVQVRVQTRSGQNKILVFRMDLLHGSETNRRSSVLVFRDLTEPAAFLPQSVGSSAGGRSMSRLASGAAAHRRVVEVEDVRRMLAATDWNVAKAARRLKISRTTLYKRIAELGIRRPQE